MPELPEVETVVRSVARHITGQRILVVSLSSHRVTRGDRALTASELTGALIEEVGRHGKQILIKLDRGLLYVHLGMTGNLLWNAVPDKYARAIFELTNGTLIFRDVRQFGRVEFYPKTPAHLERVGPDALHVEFPEFYARLKQRKSAIKPLLLNQTFISGVGNIYADEALFSSGIHPRASSRRLSKARAQKLYDSIRKILRAAIEHRGSSISTHVDACGEPGSYQHMHSVYGREAQPCLSCGAPIRKIVLGQRGTHYCARCQRA